MDYIQDRNLKIDLLNVARGFLIDADKGYYMCGAIIQSELHPSLCMKYRMIDILAASDSLLNYIMQALKPDVDYSTWVFRNKRRLYGKLKGRDFRQGRLAWINWMIACYEEDIANYKENK